MSNMHQYTCKRCGYQCEYKYLLVNHLQRKFPCKSNLISYDVESLLHDLENEGIDAAKFSCKFCNKRFTDSSNRYRHQKNCTKAPSFDIPSKNVCVQTKNVYVQTMPENTSEFSTIIELTEKVRKLELELTFVRKKKDESFYQGLLEEFLGGGCTHKKVSCGITDITTDTSHCEIKEWKCWKEAVGQLVCYNQCDPRQQLKIFAFGKYSNTSKQEALRVCTGLNIQLFEFQEDDVSVSIYDIANNTKLYTIAFMDDGNTQNHPTSGVPLGNSSVIPSDIPWCSYM